MQIQCRVNEVVGTRRQPTASRQFWPTERLRGFTLVELLVVVAIMGILAAIAFPVLDPLIARLRRESFSEEMAIALSYARSEAIKRSTTVAVVPKIAGDWASGLTIFTDANADHVLDAGETVIYTTEAMAKTSVGIQNRSGDGTGALVTNPGYLSFDDRGDPRADTTASGSFIAGSVMPGSVQITHGTDSSWVMINYPGRIYTRN